MKCLFFGISTIAFWLAVAIPTAASATILSLSSSLSFADRNQVMVAQNNEREFELEDFDFWAEQCLVLRDAREYDKALESCEKAITLQPDLPNTPLWLARGNILSQLGRYPEALGSLQRVVAVEPNHSLAITEQCVIFYQLGDFNQALDTCDQALQLDGNWGDRSPAFAWYYRGLVLRDLGRLETALNSFDRALALDASNPLIIAGRCETIAAMPPSKEESSPSPVPSPTCGLNQAIAAYERAITITPGDVNLWIQQGLALEQQGDNERALAAYEQAIQLNPKSSLVLARRCGILNNLKNYEAALESCTNAFQGDERWGWQGASALFRRCEVLQQSEPQSEQRPGQQPEQQVGQSRQQARPQSGQESESAEELSLVCNELSKDQSRAEPRQFGSAFAWNQQSIALAGLGRYEEALASADRSIAIDPYYASAWNSKAVSLWGLNKNPEALAAVKQAVDLYNLLEPLLSETFERVYPESLILFIRGRVTTLFNQGRIYAAQGDHDEAAKSYGEACRRGLPYPTQENAAAINPFWLACVQELPATSETPRAEALPINESIWADIFLNLGVAHLYQNNYSSAMQATNAAMSLMGNNQFPGLYNRALIAMSARNYRSALLDYSEADQIIPNNLQVVTGKAIALEELAKQCVRGVTVIEVIAAYDRAIELDPNATVAQQRRTAFLNLINGQINRPLPGCGSPANASR